MNYKQAYTWILRVILATTIVCFSMIVVMSDVNEDREPFEFTPVHSK